MKLRINELIVWVQRHYDRVLALVALAGLLVTLVLVFLQFDALRQRSVAFQRWIQNLHPEQEHIEEVSDTAYQLVLYSIAHPVQLLTGEDRIRWFFVPESRFSCAECGHPVPVASEDCPFCGALVTPPEAESVDHDGDGMPSWWETEHGLDPHDPADAMEDLDGDGFTNLEEYLYDTDPNDPASHPPLIDWLVVDRVEGERFALQFRSRVRTRDGDFRFGINYRLPNGDTKTDFVEIGGEVGGFVVQSYEENMVPATPPGMGHVDRSELTIRSPRGDLIVLVMDQPVLHVELTAHFRMGRAAPAHSFSVRSDGTFTFNGVQYRVIEIDASSRSVLVQSILDGSGYTITPEIRPAEFVRQVDQEDEIQPATIDVETEESDIPDVFREIM